MTLKDVLPFTVFQLKKLKLVYFDMITLSIARIGIVIFNCFFPVFTHQIQYKLCKVKKTQLGAKNVPFLVTHDGRTIRYPDPIIKANDTVQLDIATSKITDHIKFESGKNFTFKFCRWNAIHFLK